MKKKFISYILAFTLAIPIIVGVMTGCKSNAKIDKTTSKDIYAFSATTSASYLYNSNLASSQQNGSSVSNTKMQNSVSTVAEQTRPNNITEEDTKSIKQAILPNWGFDKKVIKIVQNLMKLMENMQNII